MRDHISEGAICCTKDVLQTLNSVFFGSVQTQRVGAYALLDSLRSKCDSTPCFLFFATFDKHLFDLDFAFRQRISL